MLYSSDYAVLAVRFPIIPPWRRKQVGVQLALNLGAASWSKQSLLRSSVEYLKWDMTRCLLTEPENRSSAADSKEPGSTGRRREPTPCSPSNVASRTTVGPTSSIGGPVVHPLPDQATVSCGG